MISLGGRTLDLAAFEQIVLQQKPITITEETLNDVEDCFNFLNNFSNDKLIYGINTVV